MSEWQCEAHTIVGLNSWRCGEVAIEELHDADGNPCGLVCLHHSFALTHRTPFSCRPLVGAPEGDEESA